MPGPAAKNTQGETFILPGMGADRTLYGAPEWQALSSVRFLDWPDYRGEKTISAIAERVVSEAGISDGATVAGSSLGGIVACEIAMKRRLRNLILIGGAASPGEISKVLEMASPLAALAPISFLQALAGGLPGELAAMFARSDADFIRAACLAIFDWPGLDHSRIRPVRIHGRFDPVIPLPSGADLVVEGGHFIAITHPKDCVGFLKDRFKGLI